MKVSSGLRRLARSFAILVIAALGLLLPATAAVSLTQSGAAVAASAGSDAAPSVAVLGRPKGIFAPAKARSGARSYHDPVAEAEQVRASSVSGALGFWMLGGLSLMLLAASLAPLRAGRKDCGRGRCRAC